MPVPGYFPAYPVPDTPRPNSRPYNAGIFCCRRNLHRFPNIERRQNLPRVGCAAIASNRNALIGRLFIHLTCPRRLLHVVVSYFQENARFDFFLLFFKSGLLAGPDCHFLKAIHCSTVVSSLISHSAIEFERVGPLG
jgi:hypothetical protein